MSNVPPFPPHRAPDLVDWLERARVAWRRDDGLGCKELLEQILDAYPWSAEALALYGEVVAATRHCYSPVANYRLYEWAAGWQAKTGKPSEMTPEVWRFSRMTEVISSWTGKHQRGMALLDVAGADGAMSSAWVHLAKVGSCVTVDMSWQHCAQGHFFHPDEGLHFIRATGDQLPFPRRSFNVVVLSGILEHVLDPGALIAEARRVLRPTGLLVVQVPFGGTGHREHDPSGLPLPVRFHVRSVNPYEVVKPWFDVPVFSEYLSYTNSIQSPHSFDGEYGDFIVAYERV